MVKIDWRARVSERGYYDITVPNVGEIELISKMLKHIAHGRGRPSEDVGLTISAIYQVIMSHFVVWRGLSPEFGSWNSVARQYKRWTKARLWDNCYVWITDIGERFEKGEEVEFFDNMDDIVEARLRIGIALIMGDHGRYGDFEEFEYDMFFSHGRPNRPLEAVEDMTCFIRSDRPKRPRRKIMPYNQPDPWLWP